MKCAYNIYIRYIVRQRHLGTQMRRCNIEIRPERNGGVRCGPHLCGYGWDILQTCCEQGQNHLVP